MQEPSHERDHLYKSIEELDLEIQQVNAEASRLKQQLGTLTRTRKLKLLAAGQTVEMTRAELGYLSELSEMPADIASMPKPGYSGEEPVYLVGNKYQYPFVNDALARELESSAHKLTLMGKPVQHWEERSTPSVKGWFWPNETTTRNTTGCAGHYAAFVDGDSNPLFGPWPIYCAIFDLKGKLVCTGGVLTVEDAKQWIATEAEKVGHRWRGMV